MHNLLSPVISSQSVSPQGEARPPGIRLLLTSAPGFRSPGALPRRPLKVRACQFAYQCSHAISDALGLSQINTQSGFSNHTSWQTVKVTRMYTEGNSQKKTVQLQRQPCAHLCWEHLIKASPWVTRTADEKMRPSSSANSHTWCHSSVPPHVRTTSPTFLPHGSSRSRLAGPTCSRFVLQPDQRPEPTRHTRPIFSHRKNSSCFETRLTHADFLEIFATKSS